jgi:Fic family protein
MGEIITAEFAAIICYNRRMTWIHLQADWPNFCWKETELFQPLANLRGQHGRLLGKMETLGFSLREEASLNALSSDVVKSSAIEGERLDPEEVRSSIARHLGIDQGGKVASSRNVDGVVEMLLDATQHHQKPLTAERLFGWHAALFPTGFSGMTPILVGYWRAPSAGTMEVISGAYGRTKKVHFEAPHADRLEDEMTAFLEWFAQEQTLDPILKAAIAHFWFITIHPFEDGNGRIARAIADMALARADGTPQRFYSMSTQIELERKEYYLQLEQQQRGTLDITAWLSWFLACLGRAFVSAEVALQSVLFKADVWQRLQTFPVNERQHIVLNRMLGQNFEGFMNTSKYATLAKCSADTALRDIKMLIEWEVFEQNPGKGRRSSYKLITHEI